MCPQHGAPTFIANRWVILEPCFEGPLLVIRYRDSRRHRQFLLGPISSFPGVDLFSRPSRLSPVPPGELIELSELLRQAIDDLPSGRDGPHDTSPVPLPVFVGPSLGLAQVAWEAFFESTLSSIIDLDRVQFVRLARTKWSRRRPFRLPFLVLAAGAACEQALGLLQGASWLRENQDIRKFGIRIDSAEPEQLDSALENSHIVVTETIAPPLFRLIKALPLESRPRLLVFLDGSAADRQGRPLPTLPRGVSLLWIPYSPSLPTIPDILLKFFLALTHDLPMHEALKAILRQTPGISSPLLFSDPKANHDLRLSASLVEMRKDTLRLEVKLPKISLSTLFAGPAFEHLGPLFETYSTARAELDRAINRARSAPIEFTMERRGLVRLAKTEALLDLAKSKWSEVSQSLGVAASQPHVFSFIRGIQKRRVDVAIDRLETDPVLAPVKKNMTLAKQRKYQLRIHVGNRLKGSLVVGKRPPLDPLLSDPTDRKGHMLEVAIQPKGFRLLSASVQRFYLPLLGASEPVYFRVRAPSSEGSASFRISIFHQNHLLQSYLLHAQIADREVTYLGPQPALSVRLEYSRTSRFTNLEDLPPRALSIGANLSPSSSRHELTVKSDNVMGEIDLEPSTFDRQMAEFRQILETATFDPANRRRPRSYPQVAGGSVSSGPFADVIRSLARKGNDLYRLIFRRSGYAKNKLQQALQALRTRSEETLQIIRYDENFVFPWALLYDYDLPQELFGMPEKPVCVGTVAGDVTVSPCSHSPSSAEVYCVNGFWGVRHQIEELIGKGGALQDGVRTVTRPSAAKAVRVVAGANITEGVRLETGLQEAIHGEVAVGPLDDVQLINILWQSPPERPSVLIVLGHLEMQNIAGEPRVPRIVLVPGSKWLTEEEISKRFQKDLGWSQPRTIVLLMACESAAIGLETLNSFVTSLDAAGAAAVVGTECTVFSDLASTFAQELTLALWKGDTLGKAVTGFRRRLLRTGNPLAFVFQCVGAADLMIDSKNEVQQ